MSQTSFGKTQEKTKVLISGHEGFIGKHLTKRLDELKIDWVGLDLKNGHDIRNPEIVEQFFKIPKPDVVIHLAALAGVRKGEEIPYDYITTNIGGTSRLLEMAEKYKVERFIHFSSSSVYGQKKPPLKENDLLCPISSYGITKMAGEMLCRKSKVKTFIVRPFTVYGENGRPDQVFYKWLGQIKKGKPIDFYGGGTSGRGYTYVGDLVEGVIQLLGYQSNKSDTFNLGGNKVIRLKDVLKLYQRFSKKNFKVNRMPMPSVDVYESWANIGKAKKLLGFNPDTNFEKKLEDIIKNY